MNKNSYWWVYELKPVREIEPGWYKLKWKPLKNGTWNVWTSKNFSICRRLGIEWGDHGAHNGWGRSYKGLWLRLSFIWINVEFYILWDIQVMAEGPGDGGKENMRPLDLSKIK